MTVPLADDSGTVKTYAPRYEPAATAPPWVQACRDRCPSCGGLPMVPPALWAVRGDVLVTAHRCTGCGHGWAPSWDVGTVRGAV